MRLEVGRHPRSQPRPSGLGFALLARASPGGKARSAKGAPLNRLRQWSAGVVTRMSRLVARSRAADDTHAAMNVDRRGESAAVLFVCLGNICRSPTAEGVFRAALDRAGLAGRVRAASAGLGDWHVGSPPDRRAIQAARRRGYDLTALRGRQVEPADFTRFGWILGMDDANLRALTAMKPPEFGGYLGLLLDFAPELGVREVPDPYYGGPAGFDRVLDLVEASAAGLVARLQPILPRG